MSETTTRILDGFYDLNPKWRRMDSVDFDADSMQDEDERNRDLHHRQWSKDALSSFELTARNNDELDENDTSDDSNTSGPQSESHSENHPLLRSSPQRVTANTDNFPDTPTEHTIPDGWNLTQKSTFSTATTGNKQGIVTASTGTSGVDLLDLEGPVSREVACSITVCIEVFLPSIQVSPDLEIPIY